MENPLNYQVTEWSGCSMHRGNVTVNEIYNKIKNCVYEGEVNWYRYYLENGDSEKANYHKRGLMSFTISGKFAEEKSRRKENIIDYTGLMVFDIDKLENKEKVKEIFDKVIAVEYTLMAFISPSELGIKFIVPTNNTEINKHDKLYKELLNFYETELSVQLDKSTCDVVRLCFYSYDSNAYLNENAKKFEFIKSTRRISTKTESVEKIDSDFVLQIKCVFEFTSNKKSFEIGSRNDFTFLFAINCSGFGLNQKEVEEYCMKNFTEDDYTVDEVLRTVRSGYKYNDYAFGKWKLRLKKLMREYKESKTYTKIMKQKSFSEVNIKDFYINKVVDSLPKDLTDIVENLETEKEKDAFFVGILSSVEILFKNQSLK